MISPHFFPSKQTAARRLESFKAAFLNQNISLMTISGPKSPQDLQFSILAGGHLRNKAKAVKNILLSKFMVETDPSFLSHGKKELEKLKNLNDFTHLVTSYNPWASHRLGIEIKKKHPSIFWLADFRDDPLHDRKKNSITLPQAQKLTREVVNQADAVTAVSEPIISNLKSFCSTASESTKFSIIYNGYDFEPKIGLSNREDKKIKIGYAGSFYGTRKPWLLFNALSDLRKNGVDNIELHFWGDFNNISVPKNLKSQVFLNPSISYSDVPKRLEACDYQLLILPKDQGVGVLSSKLFDYLAVDRPILALVDPNDSAAKLIKKTGGGIVLDVDDYSTVKATLRKLSMNDTQELRTNRDWDLVRSFSRQRQAEKLKSLMYLQAKSFGQNGNL